MQIHTNMSIPNHENQENKNPKNSNAQISLSESEYKAVVQFSAQFPLCPFQEDRKKKGVAKPCSKISTLAFLDTSHSKAEAGSTSSLPTCILCRDVLLKGSRILIKSCLHAFCESCISDYVARSLKEDIHKVVCPGLGCETVFGKEVIDRVAPDEVWNRCLMARQEGSVLALTLYITCPLEGCGRRIVDDERGYLIRACTSCWRLFCFRCGVSWHAGMTCQQYRRWEREEAYAARRSILMKRLVEDDDDVADESQVVIPGQIIDLGNGLRIFFPN